jgi:phosphotransferase system enzyme I (PtsI)
VRPEQTAREKESLERAFERSLEDVKKLQTSATEHLGPDTAAIFDWHIGLLSKDQLLRAQIESLINEKRYSADHAVTEVLSGYEKRFREMKDPIFIERVKDVQDVKRRLLRNLQQLPGAEDPLKLAQPAVVVAHDLAPSQTAQMDTNFVLGLATEVGGQTSHTAIIAHSLHIPAVVGLGAVAAKISSGDAVIIDGSHGLVISNPDEPTLADYRRRAEDFRAFERGLRELRDLPAVTRDGIEIKLLGNIEFPAEARTCIDNGAEGIGLYRTEFLYLHRGGEPTEQEHLEAYETALEACGGRMLTIRTLDLGADKYLPMRGFESERNPFLGLRSIRYCLQNLDIFKTQLRAILRASVKGKLRVMFPLIISPMEVRQARMTLGDAMEDLEEQGIPYDPDIEIGVMIETPAAAIQTRLFAKEVDFLSIGTNDLVQYTLAVDRSNQRVASLYSASHPAVLRLIRDIIRSSTKMNKDCGLCGEMAGDPMYTLLLLGLGLRRFSMAPGDIPEIKRLIRSTTIRHAERIATRVMTFETDRQVSNYLRDETSKLLPEMI